MMVGMTTHAPTSYRIEPLSEATWEAFAALVRKHNGIFGGCWCTSFHPDADRRQGPDGEAVKQRLVLAGRAHAALVLDGEQAIGWAEYGPPAELPRIYHRKEYEAHPGQPADYRVPCFFVDRDHRRQGVASAALAGVVDLVAAAGGGTIEGYPRTDIGTKKLSASFLFSGTVAMFEREGFTMMRPLGALRCVMRADIAPRS